MSRFYCLGLLLLLTTSQVLAQTAASDTARTNYFERLQRAILVSDTTAPDTARLRVTLLHVDSLVAVAAAKAAALRRQQARQDSIRFRAEINQLNSLLRTGGAVPQNLTHFTLASKGSNPKLLQPTDRLRLTIDGNKADRFDELSRQALHINNSLSSHRLEMVFHHRAVALASAKVVSLDLDDTGVVTPLGPTTGPAGRQQLLEDAYRVRNQAALKEIDLLLTQYYRLNQAPKFTKQSYLAFEKANYVTEEEKYKCRSCFIRQLNAELRARR